MKPPRFIVAALFIPVLLLLLSLMYKTVYLLAHGQTAGLYALPYAVALWLVGRRSVRAWKGELERPWLDVCLLLIADGIWAFLVVSQFR